MNNSEQIEKLLQELEVLETDIRAEALVNQAVQQVGHDDIVTTQDGRFYREYRHDLYETSRIGDQWHRERLQLHLSRAGIYDLLPEGLFHQPVSTHTGNSATEMAAVSRVDKKKETETRRFFQPVENSFFHQRVQIEKEETELLAGADDGALADFLFRFWELPPSLNRQSAALLIRLLPHAHIITGNLVLMQQSLQILLQEEVAITQAIPRISEAAAQSKGLGALELGNDMVCGMRFWEDYTCLQYDIGPLQSTPAAAYIEGGAQDLLIGVFNSYFTPAEADIYISVEVDRTKAAITLSEQESPILGYSSVL